jgi:hypothetical protein
MLFAHSLWLNSFQLIFSSSYFKQYLLLLGQTVVLPCFTFFMLPVLPHPLTAGSVHPFSLPASLGSCASSINAKLDSWSRHRSATLTIATPSPGSISSLQYPRIRSSLSVAAPWPSTPCTQLPQSLPLSTTKGIFCRYSIHYRYSYLAVVNGFQTRYGC